MGTLFTCSIDDGYPSDMKVAELLKKYDLKGTFYIPIKNTEGFDVLSPSQIREIGTAYEIGAHTYDHRYLSNLDVRQAYYQIAEGKRELEQLLGKSVDGFCYPGGKYRDRDIALVKACGYSYARTSMNLCFARGDKLFEIPTTVQFYPHNKQVYCRNFVESGQWWKRHHGLLLALSYRDWMKRLFALFDYAHTHGSMFHLWAHSREIDELDAWHNLENFLAYVSQKTARQDRVNNAEAAVRIGQNSKFH